MPRVIHPMLATLVDRAFDDPQWLYEIKWDGYRALAFLDGGSVRLVSRNQNDLTTAYPELASMSESVKAGHAVLDGEIVALDGQGRPSWHAAISSAIPIITSATGKRCWKPRHRADWKASSPNGGTAATCKSAARSG